MYKARDAGSLSLVSSEHRYIVISGLPASGKSSLGQALSMALELPLIDKDVYLEGLLDFAEINDLASHTQLSEKADALFKQAALASQGAIITSWWHHPKSPYPVGTPIEWLDSLRGNIAEVHCVCKPEIAIKRFLSRNRHSGHLDQQLPPSYLLTAFSGQATLGPLGIGRLVTVDTAEPVNYPSVLEAVKQALS